MKTTSSPTHSLEGKSTPRRIVPRRSRSAESFNSQSKRFSVVIQNVEQNLITPISTPKSFLSDTTNIVEPRRKSWWKRLGENTIQDLSFLHENPIIEMDDILGDYEQGNQNSQENKNYDLGLPESSSNETIESIIIPQKRLFNQKGVTSQNKFENIVEKENSTSKQLETQSKAQEIHLEIPTTKPQKNIPIFPAALLNMSSNVINKTQELPNLEQKKQSKNLFSNRLTKKNNIFTNIKLIESEDESLHLESKAKAKNLFGNQMRNRRNNRFSGLIATESEDDIPIIQPKVFEFQKPGKKRRSSMTQGDALSPSLSVTSDADFNNWKMLPSSTMVEDNISEKSTPAKKLRLTRASYVNNEYCESSNTKLSPSVTKLSPETNNPTHINEDVCDINNQVSNHEHQIKLTDKNKTNIALSNNESIQLINSNSSKPTEKTQHE
ncbi:hypothetical protein EVAR_12391_1 [Eumeta japonica]|uniref:Uncharacterized protein n=1 Tax=Eumeta variegata TaxID=151549 RepID=A0A4C1TZD7_EUMVA|nr:hypothetical protein EVAR_12391_1 [Eumeta japonica]